MKKEIRNPYPFLITVEVKDTETQEITLIPVAPKKSCIIQEPKVFTNRNFSMYKDIKVKVIQEQCDLDAKKTDKKEKDVAEETSDKPQEKLSLKSNKERG